MRNEDVHICISSIHLWNIPHPSRSSTLLSWNYQLPVVAHNWKFILFSKTQFLLYSFVEEISSIKTHKWLTYMHLNAGLS